MPKSLADQLMSAGLVDEKKAKKVRQDKRQQKKQQRQGKAPVTDDTRERLQKEREAKAERDRELNRQRQAEEAARAMKAQATQMLQQNRQLVDGEIRFNFNDPRSNKIKHLYVSQKIQDQLARGQLAICAEADAYVVVPRPVAEKVAERYPEALVFLADPSSDTPDEDDPYKDFPIPDDLMW